MLKGCALKKAIGETKNTKEVLLAALRLLSEQCARAFSSQATVDVRAIGAVEKGGVPIDCEDRCLSLQRPGERFPAIEVGDDISTLSFSAVASIAAYAPYYVDMTGSEPVGKAQKKAVTVMNEFSAKVEPTCKDCLSLP